MSIKANPTAIGVFVVGAVLILLGAILFFGSGNFFKKTEKFVLYFDGSLQGLNVGAPVSMKGVQIGDVKSISIDVFTNDKFEAFTQVIIEINTSHFHPIGHRNTTVNAQQLIQDGLRAQLKMQSLLTGLLYIETDFFPDAPINLKHLDLSPLPELPTMPTELEQLIAQLERMNLEQIAKNIGSIIEGLNSFINGPDMVQLPQRVNSTLEAIGALAGNMDNELANLTATATPLINNANNLVKTLDQDLPQVIEKADAVMMSLNSTAAKLDSAVDNVHFLLSDDSPLLYQLTITVEQIGDAAYQMGALARMLEAHPEALIRGK